MLFIVTVSIIIYIVAIIAIYHNIYNFEQDKKIKFIISGSLFVLAITMIIVLLSSGNIQAPSKSYLNLTKITSILLFAPINTAITLTYIGNLLNRYKVNEIKQEKLKRKILITVVLLFILGIFEINYIRSFEIGLLSSRM